MNERPSTHMPDELAHGAWYHSSVSLGHQTLGRDCNSASLAGLAFVS